MRSALHWLVALLLCLALPLKGLAATGVLGCAPGHAMAQALDAPVASHAEHDHAHVHAHTQAQPDEAEAATTEPCGVCAPCCAAALPPTLALALQGSEPLHILNAVIPQGHEGRLPRHLERPPRAAA